MNARLVAVAVIFVVLVGSVGAYVPAYAESGGRCSFSTRDTITKLRADCTTDTTILVPEGFTLDGAGHTITAVDPPGGHFLGAVVANQGKNADIRNLRITSSNLVDVCDSSAPPDYRLRGIQLKGASGEITQNVVMNINQGATSACKEGAGIEVRNDPVDGTHPNTQIVEISHNVVMNYQMVGIVAVGDVSVKIHHNLVGASMAQATVIASSIQLNKHAIGSITYNIVDGNQWLAGDIDYVGTAILILDSDNAIVSHNEIRGNSDIGIYVGRATQGTFDNNKVFDYGPDGPYGPYEVGIANYSDLPASAFTNNKVRGFTTPYDGVEPLESNKVIP